MNLKTILLWTNLLCLLGCSLHSHAQIQIGMDIDGEAAEDLFGSSVSMPDANTMAIGAPQNDGNGTQSGHVRIYNWNGTAWVQKGIDIDGEAAGDQSGQSVSMPDANTVAIGANRNDGNGADAGQVRIYNWNGTAWVQKGMDIDGEAVNDGSGTSVSMPDANTVAIGAPYNDGNGSNAGHVRIYNWNGTAWVQKGMDINGEAASDFSGYSVSMPDANTVAIGAYQNDGNGSLAGHVRIYNWNGTAWVQKGMDIDGEAAGDLSSWSVSMPDANTVAIGAPQNSGNGFYAGHVRIYNWNGTAWLQKGMDIDGEAALDRFGTSVSMPDANTLAIGAIYNTNSNGQSGHVRIYKWNGTAWLQQGMDIDGTAADDQSGRSVSMPDANTVAIGAPSHESDFSDLYNPIYGNGQVRVYSFCTPTSSSLTAAACVSYTLNATPYTMTGVYTQVVNNVAGCDSTITLNLTIKQPTSSTQNFVECQGFSVTVGTNSYTTTGNYTDVLVGSNGCDSTVTTNLTIKQPTSSTQSFVECQGFSVTVGTNSYTATGNYTDVLVAANGCDSTVTTNLTIKQPTSSTQSFVECQGFSVTVGTNSYSATGNYTDVLVAANGCDSTVTTNLTIKQPTSSTQSFVECQGFSVTVGTNSYTTTGNYTDVLVAANGCDSTVTTNLTIKQPTSSTQSFVECQGFSVMVGTNSYSATGNYTDVLVAANGCDSTVTTNLTINSLPVVSLASTNLDTVCDNGGLVTLPAGTPTGGVYSGTAVSGNTFDPAVSGVGSYSILYTVTDANTCVGTDSAMIVVELCSGLKELEIHGITLYPNPTTSVIYVDLKALNNNAELTLSVYDALGRLVETRQIEAPIEVVNLESEASGLYLIQIKGTQGQFIQRVIKE